MIQRCPLQAFPPLNSGSYPEAWLQGLFLDATKQAPSYYSATYIVDQLAAVWYCFYRIPNMLPPIENDHDLSVDVLCVLGNVIR